MQSDSGHPWLSVSSEQSPSGPLSVPSSMSGTSSIHQPSVLLNHPVTPLGTRRTEPPGSIASTWSATRSRNARSWLVMTSVPGESSRNASSDRSVSRSRSLVGSSRISRFGSVAHHHQLQATATTLRVPHRRILRSGVDQKRSSSARSRKSGSRCGPATSSRNYGVLIEVGLVSVGEPDDDCFASFTRARRQARCARR